MRMPVKLYMYKEIELNLDKSKIGDNKVILFWTKFFEYPNWGMDKVTLNVIDDFKNLKCEYTNCIFTHDKNYLKSQNHFDAMIFHVGEPWDLFSETPNVRSPHQLYIMASKECPPFMTHNLKFDREFYNLTMHYRLDSDIPWTYGQVEEISSLQSIPNYKMKWREVDDENVTNFLDDRIMKVIEGKTKTAAWFVSNCIVESSGRSEMTKKLQELGVDVDVYGKCGSLKCDYGSSKCDEMLNSTYKFYFSFENTLCVDYVTEKTFKVMDKFIIPVVLNGADMSKFLPPKSYINVEDFDSIEELAKYLKFLSENIDEYVKYFWWKKYYKIGRLDEFPICEICEKVNLFGRGGYSRHQVYDDIYSWASQNACRYPKF